MKFFYSKKGRLLTLGFIIATGILFTTNLYSQTPSFAWVQPGTVVGTPYSDASGSSIVTDAQGYSYVTGSFSGPSLTLGSFVLTGTNSSVSQLFIAKYDAAGNVLWAKQTNECRSYGSTLAIDGAGKVYVIGGFIYTTGNASFGSFNFGVGYATMFVAKLNASDGTVNWVKQAYVGTAQNVNVAQGLGIAVNGTNNIYITGSFSGSVTWGTITKQAAGYYDMYLAKLDSTGNFLWINTAGYPWLTGDQAIYQAGGTTVTTDAAGAVYIAGQYRAGLNIGTDTYTGNGGNFRVVIAKFDAAGNYHWSRISGGGSQQQGATKLVFDEGKNLYLSGLFGGPGGISFGSYSIPNVGGNYNIYVTKYDSSGKTIWAKSPGGTFNAFIGPGITLDKTNHFYLTGAFSGSAIFGSTTLTAYNNGNTDDIFVAQLDTAGNPLWAKSAGSTYVDEGRDVGVDGVGNVYITGNCRAGNSDIKVAFDSDTMLVIGNQKYFFLAKIGSAAPASPTAEFTASDSVICQHSAITFTDESIGAINSWRWTFEGGIPHNSSSQSPAITYDTAGTYAVKLAVSDINGKDSITMSNYIVVNPIPFAGVITALKDTICEGTVAHLSVTGNVAPVQWQSSLISGSYTDITGVTGVSYDPILSQPTYYRVYSVVGNCSDTSSAFLLVTKPSPVAAFISADSGLQVKFNSGSSVAATGFLWSFGDSTTSTDANPTHVYSEAGNYYVCLTVYNSTNCNSRVCNNVNVVATGVLSMPGNEIFIYPNPITSNIFVDAGQTNLRRVEVFNVIGEVIIDRVINKPAVGLLNIEVQDLTSGMYYLRIETGTNNYIQKIVKQ